MAFQIALTLAQRDNLVTLQRTERFQDSTQRSLSSGREVNDVTDDVFRYFAARALSDRSLDFQYYKVGIDQGTTSLKNTIDTIESIIRLFNQLKGIIQGSAGKTQTELTRLNTTLEPALQEVGNVIIDSHYQGVNLVVGDGDNANILAALSVRFSEKHKIDIPSHDVFSQASLDGSVLVDSDYATHQRFISYGQGVRSAVVRISNLLRYGRAANQVVQTLQLTSGRGSIINPIVENINSVIRNLNVRAQEIGTFIGILQVRFDYSSSYVVNLNKGTDKYTLADINQEGAHLVALQTRQQLGINSLAVSGRQQNAILTLFN